MRPVAGALLALIGVACRDLPRDPDGTLARVRGGTMRVGVVENRPWTTLPTGGGAGGLEGVLAADLAGDLGARVEWVRGAESRLLQALKLRELDLVIGGLTDDSPWKQHVAFTNPFYTDTIVVAAPVGGPRVTGVKGRTVFYSARDPAIAAYVRRKGGMPRPIAELSHAPGLVAAPTWQLMSFGFGPVGITLLEQRHVMAAPPGENAWLMRIEQTLRARKQAIPYVLRTTRP